MNPFQSRKSDSQLNNPKTTPSPKNPTQTQKLTVYANRKNKMEFLTLEAKSHKGKNHLAEARKRLPKWDGKTWRVVQEKKLVLFSSEPGPWAHVTPDTDENPYWCSRWVNLREDENFTVTANASLRGQASAACEGPLEGTAMPRKG